MKVFENVTFIQTILNTYNVNYSPIITYFFISFLTILMVISINFYRSTTASNIYRRLIMPLSGIFWPDKKASIH